MLMIATVFLAGLILLGSCQRRCTSMRYHNRDVKMGIAH